MSTPLPPRLTTPRDLLLDDLKRLLTVETTLAKVMLPKLLQEVQNTELKSVLEQHQAETKQHAGNVQQAFEHLGATPEGKDAPGLEGLKAEHESGISEVAPALRESFDAGAAIGSEHYEIAIYSSILPVVSKVSPGGVFETLRRNLEHEFTAMRKLEVIAERLASG